ncbi:hypothetical protein [Chitinimonas lacunae]|uniref:Uncharacterized protein n=1 Tax=Chitinimonas lacunae TaxID=1963018 RepID=A0ABV8MX07_9NEIS
MPEYMVHFTFTDGNNPVSVSQWAKADNENAAIIAARAKMVADTPDCANRDCDVKVELFAG